MGTPVKEANDGLESLNPLAHSIQWIKQDGEREYLILERTSADTM